MRTLTLDGVTKSVAEWADEIGIDRLSLYRRLRSGLSVREALAPKRETSRGGQGVQLVFQGESLTIREWAARLGIREGVLRKRLAGGMSPAEALTVARYRKKRVERKPVRKIKHDGLELSVSEWSDRLGIPTGTIYKRLHRGVTAEEALAPISD